MRYGLLGICGPVLLGWIGKGPLSQFLSSTFVLRDQPRNRFPRVNQYFIDLYHITWLSVMIAFVGFASTQMVLTLGSERFSLPNVNGPALSGVDVSQFFYYAGLTISIALSLVLPWLTVRASIAESVPSRFRGDDGKAEMTSWGIWKYSWMFMVLGILSVAGGLFVLAVIEKLCFSTNTTEGMALNPLEQPFL